MKSIVLTGWTGDLFSQISSYTVPLIKAYSQLQGFEFESYDLAGERPPSWHKVAFLMKALRDYDKVIWIDSDVVVEKFDKSILDGFPDYAWQGLVAHETASGTIPNCGIWVLSAQMLPILQEAWDSEKDIHHPWWEQAAILERMGYQVYFNSVEHKNVTKLYAHTAWLGQEWNHHPGDVWKVNEPRFRHITMYDDRLGAVQQYALSARDKLKAQFPSIVS
jgi:hypothetical protein